MNKWVIIISAFLFISNAISYSIYDGGTFSVHYPVNWSYAVDGSTFTFSDESGASIILHVIDVSSYGSKSKFKFDLKSYLSDLKSYLKKLSNEEFTIFIKPIKNNLEAG